ncbi:MAG: DegV family protein [Oscillospiraceae bacterium]|nr:DegV family protein [Oscillospiraceae bacterium]
MREFKLYTDSTCDLPGEIVEAYDITVVPTEVYLSSERYLDFPDERELNKKEFFEVVKGGVMPSTAVIPPARFYEYFEQDIQQGFDILYIVFSSGLTTTKQNALIAVDDLSEIYKDGSITIIDSLSASLGEGLLVYHAAKLKQQGKTIEEIVEKIEQIRQRLCVWFTVDDLQQLKRGGRISPTAAAVGGALNIKPLIFIDNDGKLVSVERVRGRKAALDTLVNKVKTGAVDSPEQTIFIVHANCSEECDYLKQQIESQIEVKEIVIGMMGPVIGAHTGAGAIGLAYLSE